MLAIVVIFCRVVLGLVFAVSCTAKLRDIHAFSQTIARLAPLPRRLLLPAAWIFLLVELALVLAMAVGGDLLVPGFVAAAALLLSFSGVLAAALRRGVRASCNCFGASTRPISSLELWRNGGLLCCALGGYQAAGTAGLAPRLGTLDLLLIGLAALVFVALWLHIAEIVQLFRLS